MIYTRPYIAANAAAYAQKWALDRNPLFDNYAGRGGDCTNFVSQCILAGSCKMNFTKDYGWYFFSDSCRAPAWTGVEFFYDFITQNTEFTQRNRGIGPFGEEIQASSARPGDVVQLANELGDFYHTLIVSQVANGEIYICAHSDDALNRPLSSYTYTTARFIHIRGVRAEYDPPCFSELMNGSSLIIN